MSKESFFLKRTQCPACGNNQIKEIYRRDFLKPPIKNHLDSLYQPIGGVEYRYLKGKQFILNRCENCGLVFQTLIPNDFLAQQIYEKWIDPKKAAAKNKKRRNLGYFSRLTKEIRLFLAYYKVPPKEIDIFDFGMGWGDFLLTAKAFGCKVYGNELSPVRIKHAKDNGIKVIAESEIKNYQFDLIRAEQVFEHLNEPLKTLTELAKSLKPQGLLKISVPNGKNIERKLKKGDWCAPKDNPHSLIPVSPLQHLNCFDRQALIKMAAKAELRPVKIPFGLKQANLIDLRPFRIALRDLFKLAKEEIHPQSTAIFFRKK